MPDILMSAGIYVPGIGRFASADTIVPDPANPQAFNRYSYVNNNPLIYTDPTGHWLESAWDIANVAMGAASLYDNVSNGNYGAAAIDGLGLIVDGAAVVAPVIPGGAGAALKSYRGANAAVDVVQTASRADEVVDAARYGDEAAEAALDCFNSFSVGTMVMTADGPVPIEMIAEGDMVRCTSSRICF